MDLNVHNHIFSNYHRLGWAKSPFWFSNDEVLCKNTSTVWVKKSITGVGCSGAILSAWFVLSSPHCVYDVDQEQAEVCWYTKNSFHFYSFIHTHAKKHLILSEQQQWHSPQGGIPHFCRFFQQLPHSYTGGGQRLDLQGCQNLFSSSRSLNGDRRPREYAPSRTLVNVEMHFDFISAFVSSYCTS